MISEIATGVFIGNILTLIAFFGYKRLTSVKEDKDAPWWALLAVLVPLGLVVLGVMAQP